MSTVDAVSKRLAIADARAAYWRAKYEAQVEWGGYDEAQASGANTSVLDDVQADCERADDEAGEALTKLRELGGEP